MPRFFQELGEKKSLKSWAFERGRSGGKNMREGKFWL